ncbi:MAG: hypothetical protein BWY88_01307 [Synergistetes bacterium ADurb.Bin520]|nr:MAG: hypothetical protein BWY88_01307 [Synergistetes bacterium ADurb.Bin520]
MSPHVTLQVSSELRGKGQLAIAEGPRPAPTADDTAGTAVEAAGRPTLFEGASPGVQGAPLVHQGHPIPLGSQLLGGKKPRRPRSDHNNIVICRHFLLLATAVLLRRKAPEAPAHCSMERIVYSPGRESPSFERPVPFAHHRPFPGRGPPEGRESGEGLLRIAERGFTERVILGYLRGSRRHSIPEGPTPPEERPRRGKPLS